MDADIKSELKKIANTIRQLSMEAIQKARSGHPGLPLGCAELGAYLYGYVLSHNPKNANWINRDRFILSAGHGSMLLYSCIFLAGFDLSLDQIRCFRQFNAKTAGHPELGAIDGIEATTGPLGQGIGNSVGLALSYKIMQSKFNTNNHQLFNNKIYCLAGDGCIMEGAAAEASSLAGHWNLDNLVLIYDYNKICLDGALDECSSDDTKARYRSYGWDVFEIDGHDFEAMDSVFSQIKEKQERPTLIVANTIIGKGAPTKAGSHKVHGSPLGEQEINAAKEFLKLPQEEFYVPQSVYEFFKLKLKKQEELEQKWTQEFNEWATENPKLFEEFKAMQNKVMPDNLEEILKTIEIKTPIASRSSSNVVLNKLANLLPQIYGGSADLSCSDMTMINDHAIISKENYTGRNIKYGIREFAMGTIANGLALSGMVQPFCGTFLVFSDYLKNAIRIAALSKLQVIYQFTHDSIFLGEDGPTHQPVEHIAGLRAIPNLLVIRPADSNEVKMAWLAALQHKGPTALILSRQNLDQLEQTNVPFEEGLSKGAYIVKKEKEKPDYTLFATGSELALALDVSDSLERIGKDVRIISFPSWELFEKQSKEYKETIIGGDLGKRISIEAASDQGWHKYIGREGIAISVDEFGISAPHGHIVEHFGFNRDAILQEILS